MSKTPFHTRYNHPPTEGIIFNEPSLTEQSFAYETDINNIVKCQVQSSLPANNNTPVFDKVFSPNAYIDALNIVSDAKSKFESLPSYIRAEFDNNPQKLLDFVSDNKNYYRAVELGLVNKKVEEVQQIIKNPSEVIPAPSKGELSEVSSQ
ncbi:internal scaffolding protein [Dipodfec virus UOA04_Rod_742]|nr:internal scaffolding protein [Dipodfec virus UOA04_Rod_742]